MSDAQQQLPEPPSIPYGRQWIKARDMRAVGDVLRGDWITQGPKIAEFEQQVAAYCGARYAVAVSSGTAALHVACLATRIQPGEAVITSPISFVASANCALYCGGVPKFADIDPETLTLDPRKVENLLVPGNKLGARALIPVHFGGYPCSMEAMAGLAKKHRLGLIEDAAHALGAEYRIHDGRRSRWVRVGSCEHSDMAVLSFHPVKHITTGEGGMVLCNDSNLAEFLRDVRNHGITRDPRRLTANHGPWYYEMQTLGFNYRITDFQCALGIGQLKSLEAFLARRRDIAAFYTEAFRQIEELIPPPAPPDVRPAWHLYVLQLRLEKLRVQRRVVFDALRQAGLEVNVHYIPIHLQPYYREKFGYAAGDFPCSERYYERVISLPLFPKMTSAEMRRVVRTVIRILVKSRTSIGWTS